MVAAAGLVVVLVAVFMRDCGPTSIVLLHPDLARPHYDTTLWEGDSGTVVARTIWRKLKPRSLPDEIRLLHVSTDEGRQWRAVQMPAGIHFVAADRSRWLALRQRELLESRNRGQTWETLGPIPDQTCARTKAIGTFSSTQTATPSW
jgi:hypothetical protein